MNKSELKAFFFGVLSCILLEICILGLVLNCKGE
jgi:hypothetical protein